MEAFKFKTLSILFFLVLLSTAVNAQVKDSIFKADAIIRIDGVIVYGRVLEVDQQQVKFRINDLAKGPVITLPRKLVYAISYSNNTSQLITPVFTNKKVNELAFDQSNPNSSSEKKKDTSNNLKYNLLHGTIKVGMEFSKLYSGYKNVRYYDKNNNLPSLFASYQFRYNRFLLTGVNIGLSDIDYNYHSFSNYDQIDITQKVKESVITLGFFGRFNIMEGFVQPYLLMGFNINHSKAFVVNDIFFRDQGRHAVTSYGIRGFKADFVFRGGVDVALSKRFGLYSDIGTGSSLVQLGVMFILK
jgi:hypothetical protein